MFQYGAFFCAPSRAHENISDRIEIDAISVEIIQSPFIYSPGLP